MPYTPPSNRSPAPSAPSSPDVNRRSSLQASVTSPTQPGLPRSASYLTKHRRTPSAAGTTPSHANRSSPTTKVENTKVSGTSVRQSPPPVTDGGMPKGAIMSPPDSASDEDEPEAPDGKRGRRIENLKELQEAISQIPQHRGRSPDKRDGSDVVAIPDAGDLLVRPSQAPAIAEVLHHSFSTGTLDQLAVVARRSQSRCLKEDNLPFSKSAGNSVTGSEEDSDGERRQKPPMVRKKSGEVVRPALRPASSQRRPSSMPGTPTYSKAVHFDSHLEHVRHFLQVDRPLAVSAGSSPVDNYESDHEYPWDQRSGSRQPAHEWEIIMSGFPVETVAHKALPVRVERVWLTQDQKSLIGTVIVANLAFHKYVTCRFTLDYWKTTSEVVAEYLNPVRPSDHPEGSDRFQFTIKLSDLANLETKTLYYCIRYSVNGQEMWDNNHGTNFQVDFRMKMKAQNGRGNGSARNTNGLPRSSRRSSASTAVRSKSSSTAVNEFGASLQPSFGQSLHEYLGEAPTTLRLKSKSAVNLPSDNLSDRLAAPSGQAFANRYDFGASLSAAVQAAKDAMGRTEEGLYMKSTRKATGSWLNMSSASNGQAPVTAVKAAPKVKAAETLAAGSPGAGLASSSYEELVNKYCFFGSKQPSPQSKDDGMRSGRFDGMDDTNGLENGSGGSSPDGTPLQTGAYHVTGSSPPGLPQSDPNPYFRPSQKDLHSSQVESSLGLMTHRIGSPIRSMPVAAPSMDALSPTSGFSPFGGMSPELPYQYLHHCYPFSGTEAHTRTAIRG